MLNFSEVDDLSHVNYFSKARLRFLRLLSVERLLACRVESVLGVELLSRYFFGPLHCQ